ncbi:MAG TPA: TetR family transcriptional regulator [Anaerovoracaceae bacterium]|nr:TetR family transcriptional regulator [Anaerovoracaceae bacterium]
MPKQLTEKEITDKKECILKIAENMFQEMSYVEFTMSELARRCDMAKGTIFRYYETKETLFTNMLYEEYQRWFKSELFDLDKVKRFTKESYREFILKETEKVLKERPLLIRLVSIKRTILDKNVKSEDLLRGMEGLTKAIKTLSVETVSKADFLDVMDVFEFYETRHLIIVGSYNLSLSTNNRIKLEEIDHENLVRIDMDRLVMKTTDNQLKALLC